MENKGCMDVVPIARLEASRVLKFARFEIFSVLVNIFLPKQKSSNCQGPTIFQAGLTLYHLTNQS